MVPINYEQAALYFSKVVDMNLSYMELSEELFLQKDSVSRELFIRDESPSNIGQPGFVRRAKANVLVMERFLGNPIDTPLKHHSEIPPFVEGSDSECCLCGRCQRVGEKAMMKCARCHQVWYCNAICQRADWPAHREAYN